MNPMNTDIKIIESNSIDGQYGIKRDEMVVEIVNFGRFYLTQGYGGEGTTDGGCERWRHGMLVQIEEEDTISSLKNQIWNDGMDRYDAMTQGMYGEILNWDGGTVEKLAKAAKK